MRTVYRDIAALNTAGVPVVTESGPNGGCWLLDGYRFPLRGMPRTLALCLASSGGRESSGGRLAAAQRKISVTSGGGSGSPGPALVHLDIRAGSTALSTSRTCPALASAVRERRQLRLGYPRGDDRPETTRVVRPLGLKLKREAGVLYLVASGAERDGDPAVFRVGRVTSARALAGHVRPRPSGFDLTVFSAAWSASFQASRPTVEVRLRASPAALAAFPEVFGDPVRPTLARRAGRTPTVLREVTLTCGRRPRLARLAGRSRCCPPPRSGPAWSRRLGNSSTATQARLRGRRVRASCCLHPLA